MPETGNNYNQAYSLSIRFHTDGFSFYCYNPHSIPAIESESFIYPDGSKHADTFSEALQTSVLCQKEYTMVQVLLTGESIQVPLQIFKKEEANALFSLAYPQASANKIFYNILPSLEIAEVFCIERGIENILMSRYPSVRVYHIHTMLLEKLVLNAEPGTERLYAYFHDNKMFVFSYNGQQLLYANTFIAKECDNIVYYILSVWKELERQAATDKCLFLGNSTLMPDVIKNIRKYIRNVEWLSPADLYRRSSLAQTKNIPFDVLTLLLNIV